MASAHPHGSDLSRARPMGQPKVAGWINYYGRFRPWELIPFMARINAYLVRWIRKKYKRLAAKRKALAKLQEIARRYPRMFAHWRLAPTVSAVLV
ncbi:group II intron maturase-specific domain-containing protein [Streptomyces scopuliridis]|uniref:group II intron maturase-specific domain-containing protein n=1 Tax=Streptomyces scopuliridis TaxID=452529 RepID=UPI0036AABBA0